MYGDQSREFVFENNFELQLGPKFQNSIKIGTKGVYRRGAILPGLQCSVFHGNLISTVTIPIFKNKK